MKGETRLKLKVSGFQTDISKDETKKNYLFSIIKFLPKVARAPSVDDRDFSPNLNTSF